MKKNRSGTIRIFLAVSCLAAFSLFSCKGEKETDSEKWSEIFNQTWQNPDEATVLKQRQAVANQAGKSRYGYYCRAWLLSRSQALDLALKTADSLVMGFPEFDKAWYLRANLRSQRNDTTGAFRDFSEGLKRNPSFSEIYINRGALYFRLGNLDKALADFEAAIKLGRNIPQALTNLGNVHFKMQHPIIACQFWQKADSLGDTMASNRYKTFCLQP